MRKSRCRVFVLRFSLLLPVLGGAQPALAQEGLREPPPLATPESFREDFLRFLDAYAEIAGQLGDHARQEQLATARRMMEGVTSEQIDQAFQHNVPNASGLLNATEALRQHLASAPASARIEPRLPTLPGQPGILGACNVIPHDSNTTFILLTVQQAADVLLAASGRACDQVAVVAGFGANTALVCLPIEIALAAAKVPLELASFCGGEEDSSILQGSFDRLAHMHGDLVTEAQSIRDKDDANTSTIVANDDSNRTAIINNDNTNTANIILNGNANAMGITQAITSGFDALEMREVENNLTARACPAWMYTPRYLDAAETVLLGGRFEKVVAVVRTVIENARQLRSVDPPHLAKAAEAVDDAVALSGARPPLQAKMICQHLQRAYLEATWSE